MINIIPKPQNVRQSVQGKYEISISSKVFFDKELEMVKKFLFESFPLLFSDDCLVQNQNHADIVFIFNSSLLDEAYNLVCSKEGLKIEASSYGGALYAVQTLRQILYWDIKKHNGSIKIPYIDISDAPRFKHRGLLFDEARHFFGISEIKRLLDFMSFYKLNILHWHLTDDQGCRIEIKKYPLLTKISSKRKDTNINGWHKADMQGTPHEGYYTQREIQEIVEYAKKLNISIIPEIDMPAHFAAAMAAYNWLGCRDIPCEVHWFFGGYVPKKIGWKDWNRPACAGKESTYEFIFNVIDEIIELFPSPYFHIGGDEAPKEEWKQCPHCQNRMKENGLTDLEDLQGYFNNRISQHLKEKGKTLIVWNEALKANNLDDTVVGQYWTPQEDRNVKKHLKSGRNMIISKHQAFYFDMCYCQYPLTNTYNFDPFDEIVSEKYHNQILGMEGMLWTEWIKERAKIDTQLFPRMLALAEICWTNRENKSFPEFMDRWQANKEILSDLKVNYAEDEISLPKGIIHKFVETRAWYKKDQYREVRKNSKLKRSKL